MPGIADRPRGRGALSEDVFLAGNLDDPAFTLHQAKSQVASEVSPCSAISYDITRRSSRDVHSMQ